MAAEIALIHVRNVDDWKHKRLTGDLDGLLAEKRQALRELDDHSGRAP